MAGLETVYAVHNFEAENHDEIAFKVGEPIIVLEKDEEYKDGWWQVCTTMQPSSSFFSEDDIAPYHPILYCRVRT